jgi:hypothetical protein
MGVVYLSQARDGSPVAVKVLRPELTDDPEFRKRFSREVANLTRVMGVCTVRVIEADIDSARPFMVTEYVPGPSLSEYVARYGPPGPDMMYGLATGLAEALTAIHAAGVVHRDLKPSNVLLSQDGPKVIDFGIAQALDATSVTRTGMMAGSPGFMAPEQVIGRRRRRRGRVSRRAATIGAPILAVLAAVLVLALATGHFPGLGHLTANQQQDMTVAATGLGPYPGQEQRGVSQTVDRVVASGNTIVTMGSQTSDGLVRQQFFVSTNGGATWRLAFLHAPDREPAPLGHIASRLAGGPGGWLAVGPKAIWTSPDGVTWTLAATHGITPMLPGDQFLVLTSTAQGFLAAGEAAASGDTQAVIWTSRDGLTWQRKTGEQLGLTALGSTAQGIVYATARCCRYAQP